MGARSRRRIARTLAAFAVPAALCLARPSPAIAAPPDPDPWFGRDKALHFSACAVLGGGGYALGTLAWDDHARPALLGAGIGIGVGAAKEGLDALGMGDPSWKDFTWDVLGTAVGVGLALSIDLLVRGVHPAPARAR